MELFSSRDSLGEHDIDFVLEFSLKQREARGTVEQRGGLGGRKGESFEERARWMEAVGDQHNWSIGIVRVWQRGWGGRSSQEHFGNSIDVSHMPAIQGGDVNDFYTKPHTPNSGIQKISAPRRLT